MFLCVQEEARGMKNKVLISVMVGLVLAMVTSTGFASAVTRAADNLVADQISSGDYAGSWPAEPNFAGEPTIGLAHAYELTNDGAYKTAAESGGAYSLRIAEYNPSNGSFGVAITGAEAYALARLSAIQADPNSNSWRTALVDYLDAVDAGATVTWYQTSADDSSAVYDVARLAVAANYANHADKTTWRNGVVTLLSDINNNDVLPVMALGAAVWGLAATGDISADATLVWPGPNLKVQDLPGYLASKQAPDNSFYTKFDTTMGSGFTETSVMGTLGLQAADASSASYSFSSEIALAVGVLAGGVDPDGVVYREIGNSLSDARYDYAGETLEVIPEPATMTILLIGAVGVIRRRRANRV